MEDRDSLSIAMIGSDDVTVDSMAMDAMKAGKLKPVYITVSGTVDAQSTAQQGVRDMAQRKADLIIVAGIDVNEANAENWNDALETARTAGVPVVLLTFLDAEDQRRMLARSFFISADMAHGWHPNFPAAYEPCHHALVNAGPVIKSNANQRYSTTGETAARFMALCARAGVPCQQYAHRTDLGCGSTIGPIVAARLGIPSVDVGSPMWAMHSIRESAGVLDHGYMIAALSAAFAD